jgi:large conductance mechanosensitive channel
MDESKETKQDTTGKRAALNKLVVRTNAFGIAEVVVNKQMNGFVDFLREQSVVGLAIGLVIGTQVKQLVDSVVANFFNPLIGLFLPGKGTLADQNFAVQVGHKVATFGYGSFLMTLLNFVLVAAIVYAVFRGLKLDKLTKKIEEPKKKSKKKSKHKK